MIGFADTGWEVFSLSAIWIFGLMLIIGLCRFFLVPTRYGIGLYTWHSLFCVVYIFYSMNNPADTMLYYLRSLTWDQGPALGTRFVIFFNSIFAQGLQLSYGGSFFVFNILGSIGLIAFFAAMREMFATKSRRARKVVNILPFMPGFSFWSTAIGKDSIAFFAVGLICWASSAPYRRFPSLLIAFVAMLAIRPHMAGFLMIGLALAFSLASKVSLTMKVLISSIIIPMAAGVVVVALNYVGLEDNISSESVISYVDQRQNYNDEGGSSVDIANASVPSRMFMYVFRPLLFEARSGLGLVVSLENLILLVIFIGGVVGIMKRGSNLTRFQRILFTVYVLISWLALANTTANLGIAIRQKTMFTPMLLMLMISYLPNIRHAPLPQFLGRR